jgi:phosphohistidine phosphatase SixA
MKHILVFLIALFFAACSSKDSTKTIYVVRHAEKMLTGDDPELSMAGKARATKLGQLLSEKDIKHVFSTDYVRTIATIEPTARTAGVEIQIYSPKNNAEFVQQLKDLDGNILVVGHSNTVSQLANEFVGKAEKYPELDESEYNYIYIISLIDNVSSVVRKTYKEF